MSPYNMSPLVCRTRILYQIGGRERERERERESERERDRGDMGRNTDSNSKRNGTRRQKATKEKNKIQQYNKKAERDSGRNE